MNATSEKQNGLIPVTLSTRESVVLFEWSIPRFRREPRFLAYLAEAKAT